MDQALDKPVIFNIISVQMLLLLFLTIDYKPQTLAVPPFEHTFGFYRASKYYLQLFLGPNFEYNDPQGIAALKLKELDNPRTMRDDDELTGFAVNSGAGQIIYNIGLEAVRVYGDRKTFANPKGIAVTPEGRIALADFDNRRVVILQYLKGEIGWMKAIPIAGRPFGVAFDSKNNLYVTDHDNSRVLVFNAGDSLVFLFGTEGKVPGDIYKPLGVAVIDADAPDNFYHNDFLVLADDDGRRVSKFSRGGQFIGAINNFDIGLATTSFQYPAVDYYGSVYVTDEINDQIHKFDRNFNFIISEGRTGTGHGEFAAPRGISISRKFGQVFLTEKEGGQYLWTAIDAFFVGCFPGTFDDRQPGTTLAIYVTDECVLNIRVFNQLGEKVRDLANNFKRIPGECLMVWDGRDNQGHLVPPGEYEFQAKINAIHGLGRRVIKLIKGSVKCIAS